jgi:phage shock protein E
MKKMMLLLMFMLIMTLSACQAGGRTITPEEAKDMLESNRSIVLLDVRTLQEFNEEHIPGATLIPLNVLETNLPSQYPNKNTTFIVYCRSGNRSRDAIDIMLSLGYNNVYDLGGIIDWPYTTQSA